MKIAVDTFSYYMHFGKHWYQPQNPVDIRWYCEKSKELKLDGLHIDPYHINIKKEAKWIAEFSKTNNMYIELGACGTSVEALKESFKAAELMGASILRTFVGGSCLDGRKTTAEKTKKAKKELTEALKHAENYGIKIAVENHGDIFIEDMSYLLEINSNNLGVCFDSGNFSFTDEDPLRAIEIFGDKIICTHLKDVCPASTYPDAEPFETVDKQIHFCALGDGNLHFERIIKELIKIKGETIGITLEICSPCCKSMKETDLLEFEEKSVKNSIEYLRKMYKKICGKSI